MHNCAYGYQTLCEMGVRPKQNTDQALAVLAEADGSDQKSGEFYAMLANCYGLLAGTSRDPLKKAKAGLLSDEAFKTALELDQDNPRTCLLQGLSYWNKPRIVGGSRKKARAAFRQAVALFDDQHQQGSSIPGWGRLDALYWLSYSSLYFNQFSEAELYIEQALAIGPGFRWGQRLQQNIAVKRSG